MKYILFVVLLVIFLVYLEQSKEEGFTQLMPGLYPKSNEKPLLPEYTFSGSLNTSDNNYSDIWHNYPSSQLGSYDQQTNNIKYFKNPDIGTCVSAEFCNALYRDKQIKTNVISTLPPAEEGDGARVGYYRTEPNNLYYSIPTNENILY